MSMRSFGRGSVQKAALTRDKIVLDFRVQGGEALLYARRPRQEVVPTMKAAVETFRSLGMSRGSGTSS